MAVTRSGVMSSSSFFVCAISVLFVVIKVASAGCGVDGIGQCGSRDKRAVNGFHETSREIPLELAQRLNEINSFEEMEAIFGINETIGPRTEQLISTRGGFPPVESQPGLGRSAGKPVPGNCRPRDLPVPVPQPEDISLTYLPICVQLQQCSGCCHPTSLLQCEPTQTRPVSIEVFSYRNNQRIEKTIVKMEEHIKCKCNCRKKPHHCTQLQSYQEGTCSCKCNNKDEREKCVSQPRLKLWDDSRCTCICREDISTTCTTGFLFDRSTCSCMAVVASRVGLTDRRYNVEEGPDMRRRRWNNSTG